MVRFFTLVVGVFCIAGAGFASQSGWIQHGAEVKTRVIIGSEALTTKDGKRLIAWQAILEDGWKTYWRSPGEAGLPVRVMVGQTEIDLLYPMPERFELFGLETFGYGKEVIIPFEIEASSLAAGISLNGDFMVCKEICIPYQGDYVIPAQPENGATLHDDVISHWLEKVPDRTGDGGAGLSIDHVKVTGAVGHERLVLMLNSESPLDAAEVIAENDEKFSYYRPSLKLLGDGSRAMAVVPVMAMEEGLSVRGHRLRITFSDGDGHAIDKWISTSP